MSELLAPEDPGRCLGPGLHAELHENVADVVLDRVDAQPQPVSDLGVAAPELAEDLVRMLTVLRRLAESGNTVVVIEHNLDVIKTCDWVIDLGPEGGAGGGKIVAQGAPEMVARVKKSS